MGVVDGINSITKYNPPISLCLIRVPCIPCSLTSSLVQQWRSYCSPSGQGGAGYSSHKRAEPEEEREHARKVSYVVTSARSSPPKHPSPRLGSVAVLVPYLPGIPILLFLSQLRSCGSQGPRDIQPGTRYWFVSPTHPHPISFNHFSFCWGAQPQQGLLSR